MHFPTGYNEYTSEPAFISDLNDQVQRTWYQPTTPLAHGLVLAIALNRGSAVHSFPPSYTISIVDVSGRFKLGTIRYVPRQATQRMQLTLAGEREPFFDFGF